MSTTLYLLALDIQTYWWHHLQLDQSYTITYWADETCLNPCIHATSVGPKHSHLPKDWSLAVYDIPSCKWQIKVLNYPFPGYFYYSYYSIPIIPIIPIKHSMVFPVNIPFFLLLFTTGFASPQLLWPSLQYLQVDLPRFLVGLKWETILH